jgi:tRNA nucleotidyltransferase (CCA-adding enzyme)
VLHDRSFVDDPTRIFRGIRYENRYGFRMDAATTQLAHACVEHGLVAEVSPARIRDELVLLLEEETTIDHSLERLAELGVAQALHGGLAADADAARIVHRGRDLARSFDVDVPTWRIGLAALARNLGGADARRWLDALKIARRDAAAIAGSVTIAPKLIALAGDGATPASELVLLAEPHAPDAPLFALALDDLEPLRRYFTDLRHVRLEVTGADLASMGLPESPRVGEILGELRRRKLDGELRGRATELEAARELVGAA